MKLPTTDVLAGLYLSDGQHQVPDDDAARQKLGLPATAAPPVHGTYTRFYYHRLVTRSGPAPAPGGAGPGAVAPAPAQAPFSNGILDFFNEDGAVAHFVWNGAVAWGKGVDEVGVWEFRNDLVMFKAPASLIPDRFGLDTWPDLSLTLTGEAERPRNGVRGSAPYPCRVDPPPDGIRTPPYQYLYYDAPDLWWVLPGAPPLKLKFTKKTPLPLRDDAAAAGMDSWSNLFANSVPQWEFPLVGWDVRELDVYTDQPVATSGTSDYTTDDGQKLHGQPIFRLPTLKSANCTPFQLHTKVYLPYGVGADYTPAQGSSSHTSMMSSMAERTSSWSLTVGLSAGIEKVFSVGAKVSYQQSLESQRETERRYTFSRKVTTNYVLLADIVNLRLDPTFQAAILKLLQHFYSGDGVNWADFVDTYGTHYVNALTYGKNTLMETTYSLDAETTAWQQKIDIEANAEATLEAVSIGAEGGAGFSYGGKLGTKVSTEDVVEHGVGTDTEPAAVSFDLRPLWEIFSPVFFEPNLTAFADPVHAAAPFIWIMLRDQLRQYLEQTVGLNQPLDDSFYCDYTPYIVEVQPSLKFTTNAGMRNVIAGVQFVPHDGVIVLKDVDRQTLSPFFTIQANGSLNTSYQPRATFAATARTGRTGKAGVFNVALQDMDGGFEFNWSFDFSLDGSSGYVQPTKRPGGTMLALEVRFDVQANLRPNSGGNCP